MFSCRHKQTARLLIGAEVQIPLFLEGLCAGFPSPADDHIDERIDLNRLLAPNPPATFCGGSADIRWPGREFFTGTFSRSTAA